MRVPRAALSITAVRSSGPGGQNVNRRSTRVQVRAAISALPLDDAGRARLRRIAGARVVGDEVLIADGSRRSQRQNLSICLERLGGLIRAAATPPKPRVATRPTKGSRERRLTAKKARGEIKRRRREDGW